MQGRGDEMVGQKWTRKIDPHTECECRHAQTRNDSNTSSIGPYIKHGTMPTTI